MRKIKNNDLKKLVAAALFAALVCVSTAVIQIPTPMSGYLNLGDCFVLLSGWLLGPAYGFGAAGVGSMLADLLTGFAYFAPASFLIKGLVAAIGTFAYRAAMKILPGHPRAARAAGGAAGEAFMVLGYFGYTALILGKGLAAAVSIPGDILQGLFGAAASVLLMDTLLKIDPVKKYFC